MLTFLADLTAHAEPIIRTETQLERLANPVTVRALKVPEVAEALRVDTRIVYDMIRAGDLPTVILPTMSAMRVPVAAVDALVAEDRWTAPLKAVG